jgi:dTDP-4-amino-4,6-dideoxygalactose transaminase
MQQALKKAAHLGPLAIEGGKPVRARFLPFGAPCLGEEEINEVADTIRSGWIGTGPKVQRFEQDFAAFIGAKYAVSLNSCTAGLFLSLLVLEIEPGDEVITTPLTFAATVNVIEHLKARPVLVDICPETLNIDPALVERAITSRTKAIIPVHFGGLSCNMNELQKLAESHRISIVEDAAHAIGTRYNGKMAGTLGDLAAFSFYANKNLTTAEGGMVTSNDLDLIEKIRLLSLHGLSSDAWKRYANRRLVKSEIMLPGYKHNMPDIMASMGIHQLAKQEPFLESRQRIAGIYDEAFKDLPFRRQFRPLDLEHNRHSLHLYVLVLEGTYWRVHRDDIVDALLWENIGAAIHYRAIHTHSYYKKKYGYDPKDYPEAYIIGDNIFSLPLTPGMSDEDVAHVVHAVHKVARVYAG